MNRDLRRDNAGPILPHRSGVVVRVIKRRAFMIIIMLDGVAQMRVAEAARMGVVGITVVKMRKRRTDPGNPYKGGYRDAKSLTYPLHLSLPSECTPCPFASQAVLVAPVLVAPARFGSYGLR